ncbi:ATP-dependent endonuclease [uncultured Rothia sp.]|uniref:ATP-dependent nuclease n=1 Tax=uncultured Rothia sp. TaxID=316088 RepID=UPI0025FF396C|nr:AAA family ATPase [uncultured Rothia sp.]
MVDKKIDREKENLIEKDVENSDEGLGLEVNSARFQISAIRIKNFKKIFDTRIELGSITYLVGGNNSGKSSVLQAIHTAVSCAQVSQEFKQKVIAEASLRYSPIADFALLGHNSRYTNSKAGSRGNVEFEGSPSNSTESVTYSIEMYKGKNHNNVGVERSGHFNGFGQIICDPKKLFSVYVPGLSGVPHREEMSGYAAVFRKAASGDANLVFRNIIRLLDERNKLGELERLVSEVLKSDIHFQVDFNSERDLYVEVKLAAGENPVADDFRPVDLWGTGLLQITQIFAYVLLFKPALLLVDEPDSHIHPSRQKNLGLALERVSKEFHCKVIISTHSRHLVTSASESVKVVWMKDGRIVPESERELVAILMDLGALDQLDPTAKIIIYTEDKDTTILEKALDSLPSWKDSVKIVSYNGLNNSTIAAAFKSMADLMPLSPHVIVHRDRDFMTSEELERWSAPFSERGIVVFCPKLCDTESYCVIDSHVAAVTNKSLSDVKLIKDKVISDNVKDLRKSFVEKRRYANGKYNRDGGSPRTDDLWPPADEHPSDYLLFGKLVKPMLEKELGRVGYLNKNVFLNSQPSEELAKELEQELNKLNIMQEEIR